MKKIFFIKTLKFLIVPFLVCCLNFSCKKLIELPPPKDRITPEVVFGDSATALTAISGIYYNFGYYNGLSGINGESLTRWGALSADEITTSITDPDWKQFEENTLRMENSWVADLWRSAYQGIYLVNTSIEGISKSTGINDQLKKRLIDEIKVARALYYFNLVNLFGDVPLVTTTDFRVNAILPRASVNAVYELIIADLNEARQTLPTAYPSSERARPNRHVATALLAKVYLYRQNWMQAETMAKEVINSGVYSLVSDLNNVFLGGSNEALWQLPTTGSRNGQVEEASKFIPFSTTVIPSYFLTQSLVNAFDTADQRKTKWLKANTTDSITYYYYPFKYKNTLPDATPQEDYLLIRLAEVNLILAEALARQNKIPEALPYLNQVRTRAGLAMISPATQTDLLNAIMQERRVELFAETANRWFDLKRTGTANAVLGALKGANWQPEDALYPVPSGQLLNNPFLTQNPGY